MKKTLITLVLPAALALSACTNADRFGNSAGDGMTTSVTPGSAQDPQSPLYFQQTIGDRVFFAVDQSTLSPEAQATLDGQVDWLLRNTDYQAVIEGHADEQGTREYNLALGARRGPATEAQALYEDLSPVVEKRPYNPGGDRKGRPTKKDRRDMMTHRGFREPFDLE